VTHVVQAGENLFRIALRYDTTVDAIMAANGISSPDTVFAGQELIIPGASAPAAGADAEPAGVTHTVLAGENLFRISRRYGVTMSAIMSANGITDPDQVYAGQVLAIPGGASVVAAVASDAPGVQHTVQGGETLFRIALRYGVTVNAVAAANGISDPTQIFAGQVLNIPGGSEVTADPIAAEPAAAEGDAVTHVVQRGESLGSIAEQYGVGLSALVEANGLSDINQVFVGQRLVVPGASASAAGRVYLSVPVVRQSENLSCESASACSLLRYVGYPCPNDTYVFNALPQSPDNPHRGFVGPVTSQPGTLPVGAASSKVGGYGAYVEAVSAGLTALGVNHSYQYFASLNLLRDAIRGGTPVLIIATHGLGIYGQSPVTFVPTDGDGSSITVIRYEHSYVLVGFDAGGFWALDPWSGGVDYFTDAQLDADWARLGRQALWVLPPG
jgi:LysM repeat protein